MKNNKILRFIISIIILCIIGFVIYQIADRHRQEATLANEASQLSKMDLLKDTIDMENQTTGKYTKVENAMKTCLKEYSELCIEISKFNEDFGIADLLNVQTYQADAPEFTKTKNSLTDYKTQVNEKIDLLISKSTKESIMSYIEKENLSNSYVKLYERLMFDSDTTASLDDAKVKMEQTKTLLNELIDKMQNIFTYLSTNQAKWKIQNQMFYFNDNESLKEYNNLITDLNNKIRSLQLMSLSNSSSKSDSTNTESNPFDETNVEQ